MVNFLSRYEKCFVHEIYPDSETVTPLLTQVAHLDFGPYYSDIVRVHLLPGRVIWYGLYSL